MKYMDGYNLNGDWDLTYAEGRRRMVPEQYMADNLSGRETWTARVPETVQQTLIRCGLLGDPYIGTNTLAARWTEDVYWIYRRKITLSADEAAVPWLLRFEGLECDAQVLVNGEVAGTWCNANYPAEFDVTGMLREGGNLIVVKLSSGLLKAASKPVTAGWEPETAVLTKMMWLRKPQYQHGWDWNPRFVNVGITGSVDLIRLDSLSLRQCSVYAVLDDDYKSAEVTVRCDLEGGSGSYAVTAEIAETGTRAEESFCPDTGRELISLYLKIENPQLWYPRNYGDQPLYTLILRIRESAGAEVMREEKQFGVRKASIDQPIDPAGGRFFHLTVNGENIFCKGGNFVPPDLIYHSVSDERYIQLAEEAAAAGFNLLRIWGGGILAPESLCNACDRLGILIWHDFLFACSDYPGTDPDFEKSLKEEAVLQVRSSCHHPSLVVWCGNNEVQQTNPDRGRPGSPFEIIFLRDLAEITAAEDPRAVYWPASPHSAPGLYPNDPAIGDQHPWGVTLGFYNQMEGHDRLDFTAYRHYTDRFANEGGVLGASTVETLEQFLPQQERHLFSHSWCHHDNLHGGMRERGIGGYGNAVEMVRKWTAAAPETLSIAEYSFISQIVHAEGLKEYICNYRRRMWDSSAAVFWMYNDSWPATHSWTVLDYYLRRKAAFYSVKRSFAPFIIVLTEESGRVFVYAVNETKNEAAGLLRFGLFSFSGAYPFERKTEVRVPAKTSLQLASFNTREWRNRRQEAAFAFFSAQDIVVRQRLFGLPFGDLDFSKSGITADHDDEKSVYISKNFVWSVCLEEDSSSYDNCFDLYPGEEHVVHRMKNGSDPKIIGTGSDFLIEKGTNAAR
jgi:beta-mannosidase